jgi:hypothetical protein
VLIVADLVLCRDILNEPAGIKMRIFYFVLVSMLSINGLFAIIIAIFGVISVWVSFHVAVRTWQSRCAESDDDVWIPPRSLSEKGFTPTWGWPFYKELEERGDGYVMIESAA